jgi:hypothetical protein
MSKPKAPKGLNDHLTAILGDWTHGGDDLDTLSDAELDARLKASQATQRRLLKVALVRMSEANAARWASETRGISPVASAPTLAPGDDEDPTRP